MTQTQRAPQDAYPLDPADLPETLYYADLARGIMDKNGETNVCMTGSSCASYDALWLRAQGQVRATGQAQPLAGCGPTGACAITAYLDRDLAQRLHNTLGKLIEDKQERKEGMWSHSEHQPSPAYPRSAHGLSDTLDIQGLEAGILDTYGRCNVALVPSRDEQGQAQIEMRFIGDGSYADQYKEDDIAIGRSYKGRMAAHLDKQVAESIHTTLGDLIARMG